MANGARNTENRDGSANVDEVNEEHDVLYPTLYCVPIISIL